MDLKTFTFDFINGKTILRKGQVIEKSFTSDPRIVIINNGVKSFYLSNPVIDESDDIVITFKDIIDFNIISFSIFRFDSIDCEMKGDEFSVNFKIDNYGANTQMVDGCTRIISTGKIKRTDIKFDIFNCFRERGFIGITNINPSEKSMFISYKAE